MGINVVRVIERIQCRGYNNNQHVNPDDYLNENWYADRNKNGNEADATGNDANAIVNDADANVNDANANVNDANANVNDADANASDIDANSTNADSNGKSAEANCMNVDTNYTGVISASDSHSLQHGSFGSNRQINAVGKATNANVAQPGSSGAVSKNLHSNQSMSQLQSSLSSSQFASSVWHRPVDHLRLMATDDFLKQRILDYEDAKRVIRRDSRRNKTRIERECLYENSNSVEDLISEVLPIHVTFYNEFYRRNA
eukprot:gene12269-13534_t